MQWRRAGRGAGKGALALGSVAVAAYAFSYLYRGFDASDPIAARFAVSGLDVPGHFFLAGLALLLVPLQLSSTLRRRWPRAHRLGGWLYAAAVLVGGVSGFSLALHAQGGPVARAGFVVLSLLWMATTVLGIVHAVRRDVAAHRRWISRSAALTTSAITLRLILFGGLALGLPFVQVYVFSAWASWIINLALCEAWLRRPWKAAPARPSLATAR